jgi:hypothetical protein
VAGDAGREADVGLHGEGAVEQSHEAEPGLTGQFPLRLRMRAAGFAVDWGPEEGSSVGAGAG